MPSKKKPTKSSESRFTSAPSKRSSSKSKQTPAIEIPAKLPQASAALAASTAAPAAALIADLRNSNADVARDAATSLGSLGNPTAVESLIEVINNFDGYFHPVVRAAAASSVGQLRDRRAVESLLVAVRDTNAEPSAEAIRALAAIGDDRAINPLIEVIRNRDGFFLPIARRAAVIALGSFKSNDLAASELQAVSTSTWEDSVIRQAAVDALAK
ncbi:MAG: HEAT repeat domain-containing protein [Tepidisphaeraceae bacterium]|jgi:HEAT repeat protein